MDQETRKQILALLRDHDNLTLATVRDDGWPQATTVGYAHDELTLYFACGPDSQKARNLARNDKVSLAIDKDVADWHRIQGLSMAARAQRVTDPEELDKVKRLMLAKFPQINELGMPEDPAAIAVFRLTPEVISLLDYTKGFGHTELIHV